MIEVSAKAILDLLFIHDPSIDPCYISSKFGVNVVCQVSEIPYDLVTKTIFLNPEFRRTKQRFYCAKYLYHLLTEHDPIAISKRLDLLSTKFAIELLMPEYWVRSYRYVARDDQLHEIFDVSSEAMALRLNLFKI